MREIDYRIVIPSRNRTENMEYMSKRFPTATVTVDEKEEKEYLEAIGPEQTLVTHPTLPKGVASIRQWILDNFTEKTIVMVDDDFKHIKTLVGEKPRLYTKPQDIQKIIENSMNISLDLDISVFCYTRNPRPFHFIYSDWIGLTNGLAMALFGVNGRKIRFDTRLTSREDTDFTLQALLKDRIIYCDRRYYAQFEEAWGGQGGLQGVRNTQTEDEDKKILTHKWSKKTLNLNPKRKTKHDTGKRKTGVTINVPRRW